MPRVLCTIQRNGWSVHFMGPDEKTRVGPWLLFESFEEIRETVLTWAGVSDEDFESYEQGL